MAAKRRSANALTAIGVADTTEDPFVFPPTGLRVDSVTHERRPVPTEAWIIDFTFTMGTNDTVNVLYLPRTYNNDTLIPHVYSQTELNTFGIAHFPCGNEDYDPENPTQRTTACCLPTFVDNYRSVDPFQSVIDTSASSGELKVCNHSEPEAARNPWIAPPSNFLAETDYMQVIARMALSDVTVWLVEPYARIYKGRARLADHELRQHASILGETNEGSHTIKTFLGLAHFSPTGPTKFLDSAASQTSIILTKSDYFTVSMLAGTNEYNFFEYCNMRLHQVVYSPAALSAKRIQFVGIAFTLGSQYQVNSNSLSMVVFWVPLGDGYFDARNDASDALDHRLLSARVTGHADAEANCPR
ncbi:hypothetical protein T484DRAFT_1782745 [Baffinella frigidus]|nr:hypothetical protein T484DRAFT_1782745 [Cryptophyta sp. CCMP2293]